MAKRRHSADELRRHDVVVDRLVFLAVKRREAEKELREYAAQAYAANEYAHGTSRG